MKQLSVCLALFCLIAHGCYPNADVASEDVNWEEVDAISRTKAMEILMELVRNLDRWHEGKKRRIEVTYKKPNAEDMEGNLKPMKPEEWKGLVLMIHGYLQREETKDYLPFRTAPSEVFDDDHGEIQRHVYHIRIIDRQNLKFECIGPHS